MRRNHLMIAAMLAATMPYSLSTSTSKADSGHNPSNGNNEEFTDSKGNRYFKDAKGTIRRIALTPSKGQ